MQLLQQCSEFPSLVATKQRWSHAERKSVMTLMFTYVLLLKKVILCEHVQQHKVCEIEFQ